MVKNAISMFPIVSLLLTFYAIYSEQMPLDLISINILGLISGMLAIVVVSVGLIVYYKKQNALSKTLSVVLVAALLVLAVSEASAMTLEPKRSNAIVPTEIQTDLLGITGYSIFQLADGDFILNTANRSCTFLTKLDSSYNELWTKAIKIDQENTVLSYLTPTRDGGYALAGVINNKYVLVKTGPQGNIQWVNAFSSEAPINYLRAMVQTPDDGFAIAGFGETVEEGLGWIWFTKTDAYGKMQWGKTLSGPVADCPSAIIQTSDGGYMMSDVSYSFVPDQGFFRLIRMDAYGNVLWNTTYGGEGYYLKPECNSAAATKDGGYIMVGYLWDTDAWVVKTDDEGNMQWNKTYGSKGSSIVDTLETESGYLFASISNFRNAGLISVDKTGNKLWNITFPNATLPIGYEANFNSIIHAQNGDYIIVGSKNQSVWLAKLNDRNSLPTMLQSLPIINIASAVAAVTIFLITVKKKQLPTINC